jgi:hypothetical protein
VIAQTLNVMENDFDFFMVLSLDPQFLDRTVQAFYFYVLNFVHGVLLLLPPLEFLIEEVQNDEVEAPQIVPS